MTMTPRQKLALLVLVPLVLVAAFFVGRAIDGGDDAPGAQIGSAGGETDFEWDFLIPDGTAARIAAGETIEIVPAELTVHVGEAIRIVNDDTSNHVVGVFFVAAGETLTQRFQSPGVLQGECTVHPSGAFTLRILE